MPSGEPWLSYVDERLSLCATGFSPLSIDFLETLAKRTSAGQPSLGLVRACKPKPGCRIIDATAGWGRDAAVLASYGAEVLMLERHPMMSALLKDALVRLHQAQPNQYKLRLVQADALNYLSSLETNNRPDVVYLDPMHPARQKSALVKKDMQMLQMLLEPQDDALSLLELAIQCAAKVVVKWPAKQSPLRSPSHSIPGKTVRYDIFVNEPTVKRVMQ